jgi:hypothetical protein
MDYSSMSFESGSFDAVICLGLEPPVSDPSFVEEVKRVLTDKGVFFGVLPDASAYGLDKLLPNLDGVSTDLHPGPIGEEPKVLLEKSFSFVSVIDQSPTLGFVFSAGDKQAEEAQEVSLPGASAEESPIAQLVFCATAPLEIPDVRFCVSMSYKDLSARLGGTINELYQQIDMLDHRTIAFEGRADDDVQLIDDLEEEVRSQRALSQDQSAQIEELKQQFAEIASVPDLTVDFARLQVELAGRQKEVLDLTADFNRRFQDMIWSLEDRDVYIDSLSARIHDWEVYGEGLRRELEAREFALEAQGQVLTRYQEALKDAGLEETSPSEAAEPTGSLSASEKAILRALEDEGKLLREGLEEALSARGEAEAAIMRMRDTMRSNHAELASKTGYAQSLENRIVQEENQAKTFASEVGGLYEEVNDLKKSLEKAEAQIKNLGTDVTKKKESALNLEREMERRGEQILGFKRELMGKEIEVKSLERENINLLKVKSRRDKDLKEALGEVEALKRSLSKRDTAQGESEARLKHEAQELQAKLNEQALQIEALKAGPKVVDVQVTGSPGKKPAGAKNVSASSLDAVVPYSEDWFQTEGYTKLSQKIWKKGRRFASSTTRYWVQITDLQDGRAKVSGSKARTTRVPNDRVGDLLRDRFGVSDRLTRQLLKVLSALQQS